MNDNLRRLDALVQLSVLSAAAVTPSVTTEGARYIVPATGATGAFAGKANQVAVRVGGAWEFYVPSRGWLAENQATGSVMKFNGTTWVEFPWTASTMHVNNPGAGTLVNGTALTKIPLFTAVEGAAAGSGWSTSAYTYTPAETGMYLVEALLRPVRSGTNPMAANTNLRLGFGSVAADSVDVVGATSTDLLPFTVAFCKQMRLTAGVAYFIFGNHTSATPIAFTYGELKITRIGN